MSRDHVDGSVATCPEKPRVKQLPLWNVVLLDDDDHTYEYVIDMLNSLFGFARPRSFTMAKAVDTQGRTIVYSSHRELAELKREQIESFGPDARIARCSGSMTAVLEPGV